MSVLANTLYVMSNEPVKKVKQIIKLLWCLWKYKNVLEGFAT